jgi:hypothetical protein
LRAALHALDSGSRSVFLVGAEADAVVGNLQSSVAPEIGDFDAHLPGLSVPQDVRQRLLGDAEEGVFDFGLEGHRVPLDLKVQDEAVPGRLVVGELSERGEEFGP